MPSELFPRVEPGAIGPTSVNGRPSGRTGGLAGSIARLVPRTEAIISFCTTWATMFRSKIGGLLATILVSNVEIEGVADDSDALEGGQRVGVVATAAHDPSQPVTDQ